MEEVTRLYHNQGKPLGVNLDSANIHLLLVYIDNVVPAYHTLPLPRKLGDGFVMPTDSFLWTIWTNTENVYYLEKHTISFGVQHICDHSPKDSKYQN